MRARARGAGGGANYFKSNFVAGSRSLARSEDAFKTLNIGTGGAHLAVVSRAEFGREVRARARV